MQRVQPLPGGGWVLRLFLGELNRFEFQTAKNRLTTVACVTLRFAQTQNTFVNFRIQVALHIGLGHTTSSALVTKDSMLISKIKYLAVSSTERH